MKSEWSSFVVRERVFTSICASMDVDFPIECDDEYWVTPDPEKAFKQPEGKPSTAAFFVSTLRLKQIQALALRTIVRDFYPREYSVTDTMCHLSTEPKSRKSCQDAWGLSGSNRLFLSWTRA